MSRLKKVMIVDDEANIRNLLFDILSGAGFKVSMAKDGQDSLRQMKNQCFDLLITDINMPRLDGIGLLKEMKSAGRDERVIIMTGEPLDESKFEGEIPPVFIQLKKPFHINYFLEIISSALVPDDREIQSVGSVRRGKRVLHAV